MKFFEKNCGIPNKLKFCIHSPRNQFFFSNWLIFDNVQIHIDPKLQRHDYNNLVLIFEENRDLKRNKVTRSQWSEWNMTQVNFYPNQVSFYSVSWSPRASMKSASNPSKSSISSSSWVNLESVANALDWPKISYQAFEKIVNVIA